MLNANLTPTDVGHVFILLLLFILKYKKLVFRVIYFEIHCFTTMTQMDGQKHILDGLL